MILNVQTKKTTDKMHFSKIVLFTFMKQENSEHQWKTQATSYYFEIKRVRWVTNKKKLLCVVAWGVPHFFNYL